MTRLEPANTALMALALALCPILGACTAQELGDTLARTGLATVRGACHAADNCGVSCPEGSTLEQRTLACSPAPP